MSRILRLAVIFATITALTSCASAPPKPTVVKAIFNVQTVVNPDARGRASPIIVRVYSLKSRATFDSADFFSLFDKDKETLGADILEREEFHLMPGENRAFEKLLSPDARYFGVFAAFRDLERAQWRAAVTLIPHQVSNLRISLEHNKVSVSYDK